MREWAGGDPALLCLHGLASNARWWDQVAARLAPRHRVVAVDLRGHGLSDRPASGYGFAAVVGDLQALLPELDLREPVVVGHSWGATVALELAAQAPSVQGVVLVDGGILDLRRVFGEDWQAAEERMRPPRMANLDQAGVRSFVAASPLVGEVTLEAALDAMLGNFVVGEGGWLTPRLTLEHHMEIARALYELDQDELWARVAVPVLLLMADDRGEWARAKREAADEVVAKFSPNATVVFLEGVHDLPLQRPAAVAEGILAWLAPPHSRRIR